MRPRRQGADRAYVHQAQIGMGEIRPRLRQHRLRNVDPEIIGRIGRQHRGGAPGADSEIENALAGVIALPVGQKPPLGRVERLTEICLLYTSRCV